MLDLVRCKLYISDSQFISRNSDFLSSELLGYILQICISHNSELNIFHNKIQNQYWIPALGAEIKHGHILVSLEHNLCVNGLRFWFLHYIAPINVRFCAFIRPLMFNLLSTPRKVREQKQECVCVCVCVEGLEGAARLSQSAESIAHVISAHWTHRLFNWLQTACLLIAAGIQTRFLRLRYADPLVRAIWILNSSTSSTKTAGLLSVIWTRANDTICEYFLTATEINQLISSP